MNSDIAFAFAVRSTYQVDSARHKLEHCFSQLKDEDIWWIPRDGCNPIGIITQHIVGNLRQWAISGIGGEADIRNRPLEFRIEAMTPKMEIQAELNDIFDKVGKIYSDMIASDLLQKIKIQRFDRIVLDSVYDTMCHLALHTGQILYITRLRLGNAYKEIEVRKNIWMRERQP